MDTAHSISSSSECGIPAVYGLPVHSRPSSRYSNRYCIISLIFQWQYIGFLYFWKIRQIDVCLHFFFHFPGLIIEEVTSRPRHLLQRRITQNTPMGGILSNNFSKKEKKKYELFYLKKPLMQVKPSLRIQNWNPKEAVMNFIWIWWTFFLCFFTIYNIYNYLLTITSMHKFFLAPHLLGPLLLFVKKILISRRIRYKREWFDEKKIMWFDFSRISEFLMDPKNIIFLLVIKKRTKSQDV